MAYRDFQEVKRQVTIERAAEMLGLELKREQHQLRGACPACNGEARTLALTPQKGMFYCFAGKTGGDCLALVAHITGVDVKEAAEFLLPDTAPHAREVVHNSPSPPKEAATAPARARQPAPPFDPSAYAEKLTYTPEVEELGLSEEDARRLSIGFASQGLMRGRVCIPVRDEQGAILGFLGWNGTDLKLPSKWLNPSNVVKLRA